MATNKGTTIPAIKPVTNPSRSYSPADAQRGATKQPSAGGLAEFEKGTGTGDGKGA